MKSYINTRPMSRGRSVTLRVILGVALCFGFAGCQTTSNKVVTTSADSTSTVGAAATPTPTSAPNPYLRTDTVSATFAAGALTTRAFIIRSSNAVAYAVTPNFASIGASHFGVSLDTCTGAQLQINDTCEIDVSYSNQTTTSITGTISIGYQNYKGAQMTALRITLLGQAMTSATITPTPDPKPTTYRQFSSQSSSQTSAYSCGSKTVYDVCAYNTASTFDGLNCKVGAPPWGTAAVKNGNFVYSPKAGVGCNGTDFYDGANCVFAKADGLNPFVYNNMYYFKPGSRVASMVYAAECPIESTFDGVNCYLGDTPRGKAWVTSADKMIRFPTTAGIICEAGYYFDGSSCIFGRGPDTWTTPWIWNTAGTGVYVAPRNKVCVEEQLGVIRQP